MAYNKETDAPAGLISKKHKRGLVLLAKRKPAFVRSMLESLIEQACRAQGIDINRLTDLSSDTKSIKSN